MEYLLETDGEAADLIVQIEGGEDDDAVRGELDQLASTQPGGRLASVNRVADTIFPIDFYTGGTGPEQREHLYKMQRYAARIEQRFIGQTYFDRLIDWPYRLDEDEHTKTWNQLEYRIGRLQTAWDGGKRTMNITELGISSGLPDDEEELYLSTGDLRTQHPSKDRTPVGFPCLSHISLSLFKGRLNLTAVYRNQHFISKAYGNYVGLARLQRFISAEVGCLVGTLVCVATHADAELGDNGISRRAIPELVARCRTLLTNTDITVTKVNER